MMREFFILETKVRGFVAEARINDIPICRTSPPRALDSRPVHEYLLSGRNRFILVVEPGPTPNRALARAPEPKIAKDGSMASLRLMAMPPGSFPEEPGVRELVRLDFAPAAGQPVTGPLVLEGEAEIPVPARLWPWLEGPPFQDATWMAPVAAMLQELRETLARRDPERFIQLAEVRFREVSAAYDLNVDEELANFRTQFQRLTGEAGFEMQALSRETMDLRPCAGGRLVDCVDRSWEPLLRSVRLSTGVTRVRYPVRIARVGGAFAIVR